MKFLFNSLFIILFTQSLAAQNLVPNPSFETTGTPFCGIMETGDFGQTISDWLSPTSATPMAFFTTNDMSCYNHQPLSSYPGPIGIKGSQNPHTGDVFAGIWCYTIPDFNQRHYIQVQLSAPLTLGSDYEVSFHACLGDSMEFAIDRLGAYLSTDPISMIGDGVLNASPQLEIDGFLTNTTEWVLIKDTIEATEAFEYLTIGNFYDDNSTNTIENPLASLAPGTYGAFYFIDDVSVQSVDVISSGPTIDAPDFSIVPTLVEEALEIQFDVPGFETGISIYSPNGALVYSQETDDHIISIDISDFASGIYLVLIERDGFIHHEKIVKE